MLAALDRSELLAGLLLARRPRRRATGAARTLLVGRVLGRPADLADRRPRPPHDDARRDLHVGGLLVERDDPPVSDACICRTCCAIRDRARIGSTIRTTNASARSSSGSSAPRVSDTMR
jgi:hypothetical protein